MDLNDRGDDNEDDTQPVLQTYPTSWPKIFDLSPDRLLPPPPPLEEGWERIEEEESGRILS